MSARRNKRIDVRQAPAGFTLVELLVAVTLTVMIMTMFAQVFRTASNLITRQKGMAENGQRARTLNTIIQNDLKRRTFKHVEPWDPSETTVTSPAFPADEANRQGYFYYSENSLESDIDDILQFTMLADLNELPYPGHAMLIPGSEANTNQPEADDGQVYLFDNLGTPTPTLNGGPGMLPNSRGASHWAEVVYFVRNGNLYRRVLLIREPYDNTTSPTLPVPLDGSAAYPDVMWPEQHSFWRDFDYSATFNGTGVQLHEHTGSLSNTQLSPITPPTLGAPFHRFGFNNDASLGNPREFANPLTGEGFIGRFTQQETSDDVFGYPGVLNDLNGTMPNDNPFDPALPLAVVDGVVNYPGPDGMLGGVDDGVFNGMRAGEDILLSNVHGFDVKIWDEALSKFVDVGHDIAGGSFEKGSANDLHGTTITYGPRSTAMNADNRVYDTWHPRLDINSTTPDDPPPYRPLSPSNGPDGAPGIAGFDDNNDTAIDDAGEVGAPGSDDHRLRAIQITVRFLDVSSNQMKQVTLVQALRD